MKDSSPPDPVVVVGLGPTGAVLSHLLGRADVPVEVLEREPAVVERPRAVFFDDEVMRVLQELDLTEAVRPVVAPVKGMDLVAAGGDVLYRYRADPGPGPLGWEEGFMFHQPDLERILSRGLEGLPSVTVHRDTEVVGLREVEDGLRVATRSGDSSREVAASWVVGCDGARSFVREAMEIGLVDYGADAPWLVLDLSLTPGAKAALPDVTVQYCEPERPCTFVPLPGDRCRFEIMVLPGDAPEAMSSRAEATRLLRRWLPPESYRIERSAVYTFHALVAERWREGRVLLAGDAAHQMPPFLGQGMGAGIRDAANLAWKLERVLTGAAHPSLLDSYEAERAPHVRKVLELDLKMGAVIQTTDPRVAAMRDQAVAADGGTVEVAPPRFPVGPVLGTARTTAAPDGTPASRGVGFPFPQPVTDDGTRLDAQLPEGFFLVGDLSPSRWASGVLERMGAVEIPPPDPEIERWLRTLDARCAVVRPDRIVLALASSEEELDRALEILATHLRAEGG